MKEKIYTIPINEAYDTDCECPLCILEKKIEDEAIEYALGAAMMEPDYRTESNEKGYCRRHFEQLFAAPNKLSLALVLDTYFEQTRKSIASYEKQVQSMQEKGGFFKKNKEGAKQTAHALADMLDKNEKSCLICDKINATMKRYFEVLADMWATEPEFRGKFAKSNGVCLSHMKELLKAAEKLSEKDAAAFVMQLYEKQTKELERIQEDIHKFTLKFDYRNKDMEWGTAKDAPIRAIEKTVGYIKTEE